ncbi:MAG: phage terminase large subunit [Candidatus Kapabacteria bacterium]|nr:phage terminase large subunit [Candidatus Kapabacteria bacterium]
MTHNAHIVQSLDDLDDYTRKYIAWTPKGCEAYNSTRWYLNTLFGGAKGGSKTVTGIRIYGVDISNYRDGVFVVIRKNYNNLKQTTQQSFKRFFCPELVVSKTANIWHCVNGNQIWFYAADITRDTNYEKLRGLECSAIFVDEGSQFGEMFYEILPSLLRRPAYHIDTNEPLAGYIYITTNPVPGKNYLKRTYIDTRTRKAPNYLTKIGGDGLHNFIPSLPDDNPLLPPGYVNMAFSTMQGAQLAMLRYGKWDIEDSDFSILTQTHLDTITSAPRDREPFGGGIDVGLGRPDKTVVYAHNKFGEMWIEAIYEEYDTMQQARKLLPFCNRVKANGGTVFIDAGAMGKGVADRLAELCSPVTIQAVWFDSQPLEERGKRATMKYSNRRAQMYFWLREDVLAGCENPDASTIRIAEDIDTAEEVENTYYEHDSDKVKIEKKDNIKERLGRSPDKADALILCNVARRRMLKLNTFSMPTIPKPPTNRLKGY